MGVRCGSVSIKIMIHDNRRLGRMAVLKVRTMKPVV